MTVRKVCSVLCVAFALAVWVPGLATAQGFPDLREHLTDASSLVGKRIGRIQFRGNRKVEDDAIRVNLVSKPGEALDMVKVRDDIRAIWKTGLFDDVEVVAGRSDGGVVLVFAVKEKPSIRRVFVSGNDGVDLEKINENLDLKRDAILDISKIRKNVDKLQNLYEEEGYYLADVTHEVKPVNEAEVDVWFHVKENSKVEIRGVNFIGNEKIADSELSQIISTQKGGALSFMSDSGKFNASNFERDLSIIQAFYYDRGYINVKIGTPRIRLSRDKRYMYVSIPIDEGPEFDIGKVEFSGDLLEDKKKFFAMLSIKKGQKFNRSNVGRDIQKLTDFYKNRGYAYVNVNPLNRVDVDKREVELNFEIEKGNKVFLSRINITGNAKTRDKVIRRELKVSEGELYHQSNLDSSRRRVMALGYFKEVNISTKRGQSDEFIEVNIEVSERPTGTFQIGAGFSSVENFIAQAQISQDNLFGRGQRLTLQAQLSSLRQLFLLRFQEPYFFDTRWTFAIDVFNQSRAFSGFSRDAVGGNLTWGYPLSFETRLFTTYKLEDVSVSTGNAGSIQLGATREALESSQVANLFRGGVTSSLRGAISYDSRNNRLFPTGGWYDNAFIEVADDLTGSQNKFVRYGGFLRHYRPLLGPFILKLNAEMGVTTSRDPLGVPVTERYFVGGIFNIRGFRPRSLGPVLRVSDPSDPSGPLSNLPLGGNLQLIWNSEVEFQLFPAVGISGVVFFDAGNAYNLEDRYCSSSAEGNNISPKFDPCFEFPNSVTAGLRTSVGFGFRWFSPIGPLRFEWGIPLDRQPGEEPLVFEFTIGNFF